MSGTTKKLQLLGKLQSGVYILSEGETLEDAPIDADVVIDPYSDEAVFPEGGSGGSDLLNENGIIKQEYLPRGFPYRDGEVKAILTDAKPVNMDGTRILLDEVKLYADEEYTVTWNGVEYKSVCFVFGEGEEYYNCLGNPGALGGETNGIPFVIAAVPPELASDDIGFGAIVMPLDDSTDITISITGFVGTIQKIDEKYLPDTSDVFVVKVTNSNAVYTSDKTFDEIYTALLSGKSVVLKLHETYDRYEWYTLGYETMNGVTFYRIDTFGSDHLDILEIRIDVTDKVEHTERSIRYNVPTVEDILAALPTWNGGSY